MPLARLRLVSAASLSGEDGNFLVYHMSGGFGLNAKTVDLLYEHFSVLFLPRMLFCVLQAVDLVRLQLSRLGRAEAVLFSLAERGGVRLAP